MLKKKLLAAGLSVLCIFGAASTYALADGQKVVTLGADLSDEQKYAILNYFGIAGQNIETLYITNQDERNHLGSYVPLEQIGTKTFSCALVKPTTSGGIQVKTANLNWVTSNMIASTLSTSGVKNCEVLAAAPFEVSGTGALTGILMAYETASGETLSEQKKDIATQELITTTTMADKLGPAVATEIITESKMEIIEREIEDDDEISSVVENIAQKQNIELSEDDRAMIQDLLEKIAEQEYNYEDMKETLERVENNLDTMQSANNNDNSNSVNIVINNDPTVNVNPEISVNPEINVENNNTVTHELDSDSILMNTNESALGQNVLFDATDVSALEEVPESPEPAPEADFGFEITSSDDYTDVTAEGDLIDIGAFGEELNVESIDQPEEMPSEFVDQPVEFTGEDIIGEEIDPEFSVEEELPVPEVYRDVFTKYQTAINEHWGFDQLLDNDMSPLLSYQYDTGLLAYALKDVNDDGTDELIITVKTEDNASKDAIFDMYTVVDNAVRHLITSGERDAYFYCGDAKFAEQGSDGAAHSINRHYYLDPYASELTFVESVEFNADYDAENPWLYTDVDTDMYTSPDFYAPIDEATANDIIASYETKKIEVETF